MRSLYLIPAAMSFAASAVVWRYIFLDGPGYGVLDYVTLEVWCHNPPDWLASTTWALPALDIITIWLSLPIATFLYLAALQRIPDSVIEAAHSRRSRNCPPCAPHRLARGALHDAPGGDRRAALLHQRLVRPC